MVVLGDPHLPKGLTDTSIGVISTTSLSYLAPQNPAEFGRFRMARFMIHWCAPDPTNEKYTQAIVDYIKGGKPMDEYAGFKVLARQIHPHLGGGCLLVEADNLVTVQKHTYPWTKGLGVTATITPGLSDEEYVELEESMSS